MKTVYVDMDGVLCDFFGASKKALTETPQQRFPQAQWGFFLKLSEIKDSIKSINILKENYDVWILTRASHRNVNCYTEKAQWIWDHLGFDMLEKLIICSDKSKLKGHYLIDDQNNAHQDKFEGKWIQFGSDRFPNWEYVTKYMINQLNTNKQELCESLIGQNEEILGTMKCEVRIFDRDNTKISPPDTTVNFDRLNIKIISNIIDQAYFG